MSILDALAGVCLYERRHQAFAVSMSISQEPTPGVTLYVSQNGTVPQFVVRPPPGYSRTSCTNQDAISRGDGGFRDGTEGDG